MKLLCMICIQNVSTRLGCPFPSASASGFWGLWHWLHICKADTLKFSASCKKKKKKNLVSFNNFFFSSNQCFREAACNWPPFLAAFPPNPNTIEIAQLVLSLGSEPVGLSCFCLCVYQRTPLHGSCSQWVIWKLHTWFALKLGEPVLSLELI